MKESLLPLLACPICRGDLVLRDALAAPEKSAEIASGKLICVECAHAYPIERGIPRFVPPGGYADSFGLQWNLFKWEQIDAANRTPLSRQRLHRETGWDWPALKGRWVLDAGCGAGRFLTIAAQSGAQMVGLDISAAINAADDITRGQDNVHLVQGSILAPPFKPGVFDCIYCIGVLQHTPDPPEALAMLTRLLGPGGGLAATIYERRLFTKLTAKYLVRPVTRRLPPRALLRGIRILMPILWPITEVLYRLPVVGRVFRAAIPVANYVEKKELTWRQRYRWAVLDTFDMLSPAFDFPQTETDVRQTLAGCDVEDIVRLPNPGLNVVCKRRRRQQVVA